MGGGSRREEERREGANESVLEGTRKYQDRESQAEEEAKAGRLAGSGWEWVLMGGSEC